MAEQFAIAEAKLRAWTSVDEEDGDEEEYTDSCDEDNSKNNDLSLMTESTGMHMHPQTQVFLSCVCVCVCVLFVFVFFHVLFLMFSSSFSVGSCHLFLSPSDPLLFAFCVCVFFFCLPLSL